MQKKRGMHYNRGQVSIFIIIAIVIVAAVGGYFLLRGKIQIGGMPTKFQPIEQYFLGCIKGQAEVGIDLLGSQGGRIEIPEFEPGNEYRPFSNQLNFLGTPVPYWYYVSGKNIIKEQVPNKGDMEKELGSFVKESLKYCDFADFETEGYEIDFEVDDVKTSIKDNSVDISVDADLKVNYFDETGKQSFHNMGVRSSLGRFYEQAIKIYNFEKKNMFLEEYAIDVMRLYAPVDGVELECAPKVWLKSEIDDTLKQALSANMQAIKLKGNYYQLSQKENKYFVQDLNVNEQVNFLYSSNWPTRIEIDGEDNDVLLAEPVGMQKGLGVLGFCYIPYHFVYDINYPVLVQIFNNNELFQFPIAVVIDKNKPREPLPATALREEIELCKYLNQDVVIYTYNTNLDPVEADISFNCLGETCNFGKTEISGSDAVLRTKFPQCVNGFIIAKAEDYADKSYLFSSNQDKLANVILDKLYDVEVDLRVDGITTSDFGVVIFDSEDNRQVIAWPDQKEVQLSEGEYDIKIYVYRQGSINIPSVTTQKCVEMTKPGLAGLFGATTEKCYDLAIPGETISNVVSGGGESSEYIVESQLEQGKVRVDVNGLFVPSSLEQLQNNYNLLEKNPVYIDFVG